MSIMLLSKKLLYPRSNLLHSQCRSGYIVLLPEVSQVQSAPEILLHKTDGLPEISSLTTEKCVAGIGKHTIDLESALWKIEEDLKDGPPKDLFAEVLDPLEKLSAPLDAAWGLMKTLYLTNRSRMPEKCYMSIHDRARSVRAQKFNSSTVYRACKEWNNANAKDEQQRVVGKFLLEGRLNGLDLNFDQQTKLKNVLNQLAQERAKFKHKVEIATKSFKHVITSFSLVKEFPEDLLRAMARNSLLYKCGPWTVTLEPHIYSKFMEYCPDPDMRWNVWQANVKRCSGYANKDIETSTHLEAIRAHRRDQAIQLGFENFADMSMQTKMAGNVANVQAMLNHLLAKAYPAQERELKSLQKFATGRQYDGPLQIYDIPYWRRKQLKTEYSYNEEQLREYFPLPKVLEVLFELSKQLFGLRITHNPQVDTWHESVRFYYILDEDTSEPVAGFYLDPYIRDNEKLLSSGELGWMVALRNRSFVSNTQPLAALVFNFRPPSQDKPSLLSFREVRLLFQKFGHALQHLLTTTSYMEVSGLSNIEWDAVETCSHVMAHWLHDHNMLRKISSHYQTEAPLPEEKLDNLICMHKHMAGFDLCQELYLAALDLELHTSKDFWLDIVRHLWPQYFMLPLDKHDSHPCSFTAIFSEEWGAAYYCHLWARLVAADVFSAFEEIGLENTEELTVVGKRFRSTFLALGGGCHPSEVFRRFRGRDPSPNALLRSLGLKLSKSAPVN